MRTKMIVLLIVLVSGALLARRLMGAFGQPLAPAGLIVFAVVMTVLVAAVRALWRRVSSLDTMPIRGSGLLLDMLLSLGVLCLATSLSLPDSAAVPLGVLWCLLVAGELVGWSPYYRPLVRGIRTHGSSGHHDEEPSIAIDEPPDGLSARTLHETEMPDEQGEGDEFELLPPGVSQRMTRATEEDGEEVVYGVVRCDFAAGQRQQNLHIAFCPPLARIPELTTDQIDGPIVRIKPSMVETYGAKAESVPLVGGPACRYRTSSQGFVDVM